MPVSDCAAGLAAHPPVLGTFQGSPQPGGAIRSRWHPASHKASVPPISRPTAAEPRPAPPVVLQRMSLPADRHPRRPTRGNFLTVSGLAKGPNSPWCISCRPVSLPTAPRWPCYPRPCRLSARWCTSCRSFLSSSCCLPLCAMRRSGPLSKHEHPCMTAAPVRPASIEALCHRAGAPDQPFPLVSRLTDICLKQPNHVVGTTGLAIGALSS